MIMIYYEIGTIIDQRKVWGNKYIERLSNDLKEYGMGYSVRNLEFMMNIAREFSSQEISKQPVSQIPWGSLVKIMQNPNLMKKCYSILIKHIKMVGLEVWY